MPKLIFLLFLFLLQTAFSAWGQTIPRIYRNLHFWIYGKDAWPISEKTGYKVKVEKDKLEESKERSYYRSHTLHINDDEIRVKDFPARFAIEKGKKSMQVESSINLDSVPFMPGDFLFPDCYGGRFRKWQVAAQRMNFKHALKPAAGITVLNRDLKYFKRHQPELRKEVEALQKFILPTLGGKEENNFTAWAAAPGNKVFLAVATNYYQRFQKLVLTEAGGKTTVLNPPPEKSNTGLFATDEAQRRKQAAWKVHDVALRSDREFYFIFEDHEKRVQVWRSENAGQTQKNQGCYPAIRP